MEITYSDELIQAVWEKGLVQQGFDPAVARKDACGAWMLRNQYGNTDSEFGWEIDHVYPRVLGGTDVVENLRPMQWQNNRTKGDDYPTYTASIKGVGNQNQPVEGQFTVNEELRSQLTQIYHIQ